ncbi:myelin-oligodendrocyte glycoprotein-like [Dromiciops gliroides]|uniref:myelin-oligodendrocyte glycoprotein-like n=1 Tax=Dromiciops gliroides TaxID=33562 RepID=UPI001CC73D0A|nr:myelin-oligodendrocyte glycoprotein-like [Dromiciops gliroides]
MTNSHPRQHPGEMLLQSEDTQQKNLHTDQQPQVFSSGVTEILSPSASFLSNFVITFIIILKMPTLSSRQFSVIGPAESIQAPLGGEAELPCYLSPSQSAQHMEVIWFQSTHMVHIYRDGEDQFGDQAPNYQERTELLRDAITSGNVTLKIRDVRYLDAGRYTCLFGDGFHQEEADMELKVLGEELGPGLGMMCAYMGKVEGETVFPALLST